MTDPAAPTTPRPTESIDRLRSEANIARYADMLAEAHYEDIYAVLDWAEARETLDVELLDRAIDLATKKAARDWRTEMPNLRADGAPSPPSTPASAPRRTTNERPNDE